MGNDSESDAKQAHGVLLVEDDQGDQKLIKMAIKGPECEINLMITSNGEAGLDYLHKCKENPVKYQRPSIILLDLNMPGMGGKEFLRTIKKDPDLCIIPVVVVTTSDSEKDVQECYQLQAAGYIQKLAIPSEFREELSKLTRYWFTVSSMVEHKVCEQEN
ncbi:MAG: response regulator [Sedimentisphaerales bacterium]|nr:response regulator [Sedimentisphaerales bacterium]